MINREIRKSPQLHNNKACLRNSIQGSKLRQVTITMKSWMLQRFCENEKGLFYVILSFSLPKYERFFTSFDATYTTYFYWRNQICRTKLSLGSSKWGSFETWKSTIHRPILIVTWAFHRLIGSPSSPFLFITCAHHACKKGKRQLNNWLTYGRERSSFIYQESTLTP